jgi:hypothetical protein
MSKLASHVSVVPPLSASLAEFLLRGGGVIAGGMALLGGATWFTAVNIRDYTRYEIDVRGWVETGTGLGFVLGVVALVLEQLGVS